MTNKRALLDGQVLAPSPDAQVRRRLRRDALHVVLISVAFVVVAVSWAALASVDRVVTAMGIVQPRARAHIVNHPLGGRIERVFVTAGSLVAKGQPLLQLDPLFASAEVDNLRAEHAGKSADCVRLEADLADRDTLTLPAEITGTAPALAALQASLLRDSVAGRRGQRRLIEAERDKAIAAITHLTRRTANLQAELALAQSQERSFDSLMKMGAYPRMRLVQAQRDLLRLRSDLDASTLALANARADRTNAVTRLEQFDAAQRAKTLDTLSTTRRARDDVAAKLAQYTHQLDTLLIRAPIAGYVEALSGATPGQSITRDAEILRIVPDTQDFVVEVLLANRDVAQIRTGDAVTLKLLAYDYQHYGTLAGSVATIATDAEPINTTPAKAAALIYKVLVTPAHAYVATDPAHRLTAGMQAEVDIHVGRRTVLSYVTDALFRVGDQAFRE